LGADFKMPSHEDNKIVSESLIVTQENINPFLEYELEELLNIPVVIGPKERESEQLAPELSEIEQIKDLPSTASGEPAESIQQLASPNSEDVVNQHLGQPFNFEQIYQALEFPKVDSVSRDIDNFFYVFPNTNDVEVIFISNNNITVSSDNTDVISPCDSVVTTFLDTLNAQNNAFSLRDAIVQANQQETITEIHLCSGEYILERAGRHEDNSTVGDLDISTHLIISGHDKNTTIINGNNLDRIFQVLPNAKLELHDLTLIGGDAHSFNGGAILNMGSVVLNNVNILDNSARIGGGIFNATGSELDIEQSVLVQNQADLYGGGIFNNDATTHIDASIVQQNFSGVYGAGVANLFGNISIEKSLIFNNHTGILGAGIANFVGELVVDTATISGNMAGSVGGGIANFYGQSLSVYNSTITDNEAEIAGAGVYNIQSSLLQNPIIQSSIIAQNHNDQDLFGTAYQSLGYNLIGNADDAMISPVTEDLIGSSANPMLANLEPLSDNGGATKTHGLLANSLAIDHGNPLDLTSDQRDFAIYQVRDMGAFEYNGLSQNSLSLLQISDILLDFELKADLAIEPTVLTTSLNSVSTAIEPDTLNADLYHFLGGLPSISEQLHAIESDNIVDMII